ncbi:glycosyl hydrolase, partial [Halolactibacillus miurensis]
MKRYKRKLMRGMACMMLMLLALQMVLPYVEVQAAPSGQVLDMSDPEASQYTKELFAYLKGLGGDEILFGQQHAIDEGLTLTNDGNRVASDQSEVKNAVGNYPAIFGWDTNSLDGRERPGNAIGDVALSYEERLNNLAASMKKAHELGGIVTLSMHPNNFVTGGNYNDTAGNVVREILPENSQHEAFNAWLDQIVDLSHKVVDENGEAIPIIFRPFHEQTGSWFWWGQSSTTPEDYKAIFRYTVDYLHEHGNHNILIGFSPGSGPSGDKDRYFETYPGDDYVDILGIDSYDNKANAGSEAWINSVAGDLHMLAEEAETRGKVSALTEFGYSAQGMNETGNTLDWWTKVLDGIMNNAAYPKAKETSYMLTWANFGFPNNMYVPYKDVNGDLGGDHELLTDFTKYYEDQRTVFASEANIYNQGIDYTVSDHDMDLFVVGPTNGTKLTTAPTTLRAKVNHGIHPLVTYQASTGEEVEMVLDGNYYTATYTPDALFNNGSVDVTYRYYENDEMIDQESHRYFVTIDELVVKTYDFAENIDGIKTNGTYSNQDGAAPELTISHSDFNGGSLKLDVTNMDPTVWWQELKLELTDVSDIDVTTVNQVRFDVYVPTSAGEKALANTVMLPPDWETKYTHEVNVHDYDTVTVEGKDYYHVEAAIDLPKVEEAEGLAISLVGKQMTFDEALFLDNIQLMNVYQPTVKDPLVVDDFEGYMGDNDLLDRAYSDNGDPIHLALSSADKQSGDYGLQFDYTLGSAGYSGKQISLGGVDWSETNGVSFWLKHEAQRERHLTVQIQIGGVSFESNVELNNAYEGVVSIPFSDFAPAHWESNQTAVIDSERIQKVTQFALYMGGETGGGTLYFDDIKATTIEGAEPIPDKETGPIDIEPLHFTFDESNEEFSGAGFDVVGGHYSGTLDLAGKKEVKRSFGQSLEGYQYIVARINYGSEQTVGDVLKAKVFIKTGDDWAWSDSGEVRLKQGEYVDVIFDLSTVEDLSAVRELGIEFSGSAEGEATVHIDYISIVESLDRVPSDEE